MMMEEATAGEVGGIAARIYHNRNEIDCFDYQYFYLLQVIWGASSAGRQELIGKCRRQSDL